MSAAWYYTKGLWAVLPPEVTRPKSIEGLVIVRLSFAHIAHPAVDPILHALILKDCGEDVLEWQVRVCECWALSVEETLSISRALREEFRSAVPSMELSTGGTHGVAIVIIFHCKTTTNTDGCDGDLPLMVVLERIAIREVTKAAPLLLKCRDELLRYKGHNEGGEVVRNVAEGD